MLEHAMAQVVDFYINKISSYSQQYYSVLKLHGSTNWAHRLGGAIGYPEEYTPRRIINEAASLSTMIGSDCEMVDGTFDRLRGAVPAIAVPVDKKDQFSCPPTHIKKLEELLPRVNKILVIGWRATETEFLNMLRTQLSGQQDLMIVSWEEKGAKETFTNLGLGNPLRYPNQNQIVDGFTGLINNLDRLNAFLRS